VPVRTLEYRDPGVQFKRAVRIVSEVREVEFRDADVRDPGFELSVPVVIAGQKLE
jgi:hypothetical protein